MIVPPENPPQSTSQPPAPSHETQAHTHPHRRREGSGSHHARRPRKSITILSHTASGEPSLVSFDPDEQPPPYAAAPPALDGADGAEEDVAFPPSPTAHTHSHPHSHSHSHPAAVTSETTPLLPSSRHPHSAPSAFHRYFYRLVDKKSWFALSYLLALNVPLALLAWVFAFVGTVLGTTLLLTLPLGVCVWWVTLVGVRAGGRAELLIQYTFNPPSNPSPPPPPRPIFHRDSRSLRMQHASLLLETGSEGDSDVSLPASRSPFIAESYLLFTDPYSFRCLLYFLIPKACIALSLFILFLVLTAAVGIGTLGLGMPLVLRWARRAGGWQRRVALDMLR
ncbi:hypothetical protein BT69DRAFT_1336482 [Atractiella rhizophila]|nr:hypothetical protein BT69DRAFT_1336482 [Atractiella rhizophila]